MSTLAERANNIANISVALLTLAAMFLLIWTITESIIVASEDKIDNFGDAMKLVIQGRKSKTFTSWFVAGGVVLLSILAS